MTGLNLVHKKCAGGSKGEATKDKGKKDKKDKKSGKKGSKKGK